ncbi:SDR family oxidoreductase [Hymenobacter coccineus]|uniref:3-ketoacyl-ACP reductase n=1 Tax=Hymenobacter coccineus TaxID=1908235 RepID=A0A1G1TGP7_9BACT|nr:SDR family oxidoreductase [Hymenobacter coccineus]OGX90039.1 3-ketoacyl-ACP reductase [Hymenobacter coccineus]
MLTLENKVMLITGASRGIGAAIAQAAARAGAHVIVNYAGSLADADAVVAAIAEAGGQALAVQADVSQPADVKRLFAESIARFGRVDVLVNNAGIMALAPLKDTTDEDFQRMMDVNVKGVFNTLREAATQLAEGGSIINFSSSTTRVMMPNYAAYCASKGAVEQLTRVFAKEMGPRRITVNTLSPGPVDTELFTKGKSAEVIARIAGMSAFNRIAEPPEIADVVLFLASDHARWISGQNLGANGAFA